MKDLCPWSVQKRKLCKILMYDDDTLIILLEDMISRVLTRISSEIMRVITWSICQRFSRRKRENVSDYASLLLLIRKLFTQCAYARRIKRCLSFYYWSLSSRTTCHTSLNDWHFFSHLSRSLSTCFECGSYCIWILFFCFLWYYFVNFRQTEYKSNVSIR